MKLDANLLQEIVRRLVLAAQPEKVILFGSHARGDSRPDSDIDLLVVADVPQPRHRRAAVLYGAVSDIPLAMDIVVYRPDEVLSWSEVPQAFVTTAVREGTTLYEKYH